MATTALVVEILVAGLLALAWLVVIPAMLLFPELRPNLAILKDLSGYSVLLGLLVLAGAYPLGWLVNYITYTMAKKTYRRSLLREIFGRNVNSDVYQEIKTLVMMEDSCSEVVKNLQSGVSVHRLARAAGFNLLVIGSLLLFQAEQPGTAFFGQVCLVLGLSFWLLAIQKHRVSFIWIKYASARFPEGKILLARCQGKGKESGPSHIQDLAPAPAAITALSDGNLEKGPNHPAA